MIRISGQAFAVSLVAMTAPVPTDAQLRSNGLPVTCCVVESLGDAGTSLLLKNTSSGELIQVTIPSNRYRVGQAVDLNSTATAMAITPFPAEYLKESTINSNNAWKMQTRITVSKEGVIAGRTLIKSSDALAGFSGGVEVLLVGRDDNILHHTSLRTYGVTGTSGGTSERIQNWNETASISAINKLRAIVIHHSYEPTVRLAASSEWINDNAHGLFRVLTCTALKDGATSPGLRRPAAGIQLSRAIRCSE